mmetsp:Transcript_15813/g.37802  ORF Transcript_15813/g.37802 Transcript_15813/m.37802 type:complete len:89 (+) Transcript_15813:161-427(+)|eukprot:2700333-Rhodomonas_salina.1
MKCDFPVPLRDWHIFTIGSLAERIVNLSKHRKLLRERGQVVESEVSSHANNFRDQMSTAMTPEEASAVDDYLQNNPRPATGQHKRRRT